jgi:tyrosyl-tRNA synthetase
MLAGGATPESVRMAQARLEQGTNPMEIKRELGRAIVKRYHGQEAATLAEEEFLGVFSRKDQLPEDMLEFAVTENPMRILEIMMNTESAPSLSEARRLIQQGGVTLNGYRVTDVNAEVFVKDGSVLKVGKRRFARLRVSQ